MRIALVFNPYDYQVYEENLRVVQKYFGTFPPLSLAWVAAILERHGHEAIIVDARTLGLTMEEAARVVEGFRPDLVGFTVTVYAYQDTLAWIRHMKSRIGCPIIIGGYGVGLYPEEMVSAPEIDFGFVGHVNRSLPLFLEQWRKGRDFRAVPNLLFKEEGLVVRSTAPAPPFHFDDLPRPARHLLPNDQYASFPTQRRNYTAMVTSEGCPFKCTFCNNAGTPFTARSPAAVLGEIEECYEKYHVREFDFFDYDIAVRRPHLEGICDGLIARRLDVTWACRARVDTMNEHLLEKMRRAGCHRIYYGLESGVQSVLDAMHKGITLAQVRRTLSLTKRAGIETLGYFMVGNTGDTRGTVEETIRFAKSLDLDYLQCCKLIAKPGTGVYRELVRTTGRDWWRDFILGAAPEILPRPWTTLTSDEVDELAKRIYVSFHARLPFMVRSALKVRSLGEFRRKLLAFLEMLLLQERTTRAVKGFRIYRG